MQIGNLYQVQAADLDDHSDAPTFVQDFTRNNAGTLEVDVFGGATKAIDALVSYIVEDATQSPSYGYLITMNGDGTNTRERLSRT